jgi:FkbM family methyltransferase
MQLLLRLAGQLPSSWIQTISAARWRHPWLKRGLEWIGDQIRNRDGVIQHGLSKGLLFNPGPSQPGFLVGTSEPGVQRMLATFLKPGMTVYDGGANVGFISILAARLVGPGGRVFCFEPLPSNSDRIEHNACLNGFDQITVRREALGGSESQGRFLVGPEVTRGHLESESSRSAANADTIAVHVRRLDCLIADERLPQPDFIKLDVEGAEADVLEGGKTVLRQARPILLIELHGTNARVARTLEELEYHAVVMGCPAQPIAQAFWNAIVVAVPQERPGMVQLLDGANIADGERR